MLRIALLIICFYTVTREKYYFLIEETSSNDNLKNPSAKKFKSSTNESNETSEHIKKVVSPDASHVNSGRTIFIQNLPDGISRKHLYKRLRLVV